MYENFKKIIDEKGITPYKVSQDTGIAQSTLSDWKQKKTIPKVDKLITLSTYLGVTIDELIKEDE